MEHRESFNYISTRNSKSLFSFEEVLLKGYAPDGGLFIPARIPKLEWTALSSWSSKTYPEIVIEVCKNFISPQEIPVNDLEGLIKRSFENFQSPDVVESKKLSSCGVLELFHGPTYAFKDLAMSCTINFLDFFLTKRKKHMHLIVSTSGDTGAAAMQAAQNCANLDVTVLYPLGRVTEVQELQMTTIAGRATNIHLFGLQGTSDDGDDVMRALFEDLEFVAQVNLSNVNSINWSRILVQIAHWFYGYFQLTKNGQQVLEIACPTGAGGNLTAGCIAYKMGLPIKIIACTNRNDYFDQVISNGTFSTGEVYRTLANAMDIQVPYNIERIIHLFTSENSSARRTIAGAIDKKLTGSIQVDFEEALKSYKVSDETILEAMQRCFREDGYLVCPHTATALAYHYAAEVTDGSSETRLIIATASPIKFPEATEMAKLTNPELQPYLEELRKLPQKVTKCESKELWIPIVRKAILQSVRAAQE